MQRFYLEYRPFPPPIKGKCNGVTARTDGKYFILIDSSNPPEQQALTLRHELAHIALNHFEDRTHTIDHIEQEAKDYAARMTDAEFNDLMKWEIN